MMQAEATGLLKNGTRVIGAAASAPEGPMEIRADLVVGADGSHSTARKQAGLEVLDLGAPIDALWFSISRRPSDPPNTMARFDRGSILVMLNRGDYWQCAFVIAKGALDGLKQRGLEAFRATISGLLPFAADRMKEIGSWDDVKLLSVQVNRLRDWCREGLLCIGDAAHAMSPVGGGGINLAIQDAVAAAKLLWEPLPRRSPSLASLPAAQQRQADQLGQAQVGGKDVAAPAGKILFQAISQCRIETGQLLGAAHALAIRRIHHHHPGRRRGRALQDVRLLQLHPALDARFGEVAPRRFERFLVAVAAE